MTPLAELLRPKNLDEIVGQGHILNQDGIIKSSILQGKPLSILLFGPPGCGKTTLARLYARAFNARFVNMSAVFSGISDIRKVVQDVEEAPLLDPFTILFVDEIHRFNKTQQDAFLPFVEKGTIVLIGATTENPSFSLNNALLSRMRVIPLEPLSENDLVKILNRYEARFHPLPLEEDARNELIHLANGDGRYLLNLVESLQTTSDKITLPVLYKLLQRRAPLYDRAGEGHYNLISALHKSVRGSDPNAALYWFTRMIEGGEEPLFLARRLIRMATEDIGLADPQALPLAIAAKDAYQMLGSPEGELALAEVVIYLALAPKSNAIYTAYTQAKSLAQETSHLSPPKIIMNAPTKMMKDLGYGKDYIYDHDAPNAFSGQNYFPDTLAPQNFYTPVERGFEREMKKRLAYFASLRK